MKKIIEFFLFPKNEGIESYKNRDRGFNFWILLSVLLVLHIPLGGYYWTYISWTFGSWLMFWCVCLVPISVPVGIYMFYFGVPDWITNLFG